ncbi:MAG: ABC transporter ATP-binding protein [Butyrivibrio hungatei]|nr:ABC transporter ATP-binding protein [Butyrivibrio hungatei]
MGGIIELKDVTKIYSTKDTPEIIALNKANLTVEEGEFLSVCGVSGSGKSTLLHLIGCLDKPTEGTVSVKGSVTTQMNEKELARMRNGTVSIVLQDFGLIPSRTVYDNLVVPFYFSSNRKGMNDKIKSALEFTGIADLNQRPVTKLSGGQKQRVAIARAIVNDNPILLADEPTGQLDTQTKKQIMELFHKLNEKGKTIIMVTHDIDMAKETSRIVKIADGSIMES